jgi:tRNA (cytidine/uridine-2'-O-)-methyltransferase
VIPRGQAEGTVLEEGPALEPRFHIALLRPEIGPNAGNAGRLCLGIGARLHLIGPLGFSTDEKAVRRAGLDYWRAVDVVEHSDEAAFWSWADGRRVLLYSARATTPYTAVCHQPGDVLLFGPESLGLPAELVEARGAWSIPLPGPVRSLNLANAVAVVAYEALRQLEPQLFLGG